MTFSTFGLGKDHGEMETKFVAEISLSWKISKKQFEIFYGKEVYKFSWDTFGRLVLPADSKKLMISDKVIEGAKKINSWRSYVMGSRLFTPSQIIEGNCYFVEGRWNIQRSQSPDFSKISTLSPLRSLYSSRSTIPSDIFSTDLIKIPYPQDPALKPIDSILLGHVFGNSFVKGLSVGDELLEGYSVVNALTLMITFLKFLSSNSTSFNDKHELLLKNLNETLQFTTEFEKRSTYPSLGSKEDRQKMKLECIDWVVNQIQKMEIGSEKLIPAGWNGTPSGHTIYLCIKRNETSFQLNIFNTGSGVQFHSESTTYESIDEELIQKKKNPPLFIEKIPVDHFCNPIIWQAYFELMNDCNNSSHISEIFYNRFIKAILPFFGVSKEKDTLDVSQNAQYSGICSWKALMGYCKRIINDNKEFRMFKHEFKVYVLSNLFYQIEKQEEILKKINREQEILKVFTEELNTIPEKLNTLLHFFFKLTDKIFLIPGTDLTQELKIPTIEEMMPPEDEEKMLPIENIKKMLPIKNEDKMLPIENEERMLPIKKKKVEKPKSFFCNTRQLFESISKLKAEIPKLILLAQKIGHCQILDVSEYDFYNFNKFLRDIIEVIEKLENSFEKKVAAEQISFLVKWATSFSNILKQHPFIGKIADQHQLYSKCIEKFSRSVSKDSQGDVLTSKKSLEALFTINAINQHLSHTEKFLNKFGYTALPALSQLEDKLLDIQVVYETYDKIESTSKIERNIPVFDRLEDELKKELLKIINIKELRSTLENIIKFSTESFENKNYRETVFFIEEIFGFLPPPDVMKKNYWSTLPDEHIEDVMSSLTILLERLIHSSLKSRIFIKCSQNSHFFQAGKIYAILQQLLLRIQKDSLLAVEIFPSFFSHNQDLTSKNPYFFVLNPQEDEHLEQTLSYLGTLKQNPNYFIRINTDKTIDEKTCKKTSLNTEIQIIYQYIQINKDVRDNLALEAIKKWNLSFPPELIPPHWLVALAMSDLSGTFLPKSYCLFKKTCLLLECFAVGKYTKRILKNKFELKTKFHDFSPKNLHSTLVLAFNINGMNENQPEDCGRSYVNATDPLDHFSNNLSTQCFGVNKFLILLQGLYEHWGNSQLSRSKNKENFNLTTKIKTLLLKIPEEDRRLLFSLGCLDDKTLQIPKIFTYYKKNRNLLTDYNHQNFFFCLLFESRLLRNHFIDAPELASSYSEFCRNLYESFLKNNEMQPALFCYRIGRIIDLFILHAIKRGSAIEKSALTFPCPYHPMLKLLASKEIEIIEYRSQIILELLAAYAAASDLLKKDIFNILYFAHSLNDDPVDIKDIAPFFEKDNKKLFYKITSILNNERILNTPAFDKEINEWLNIILKDTQPELDSCTWSTKCFPLLISSDNKNVYNLLEGNLICEKKPGKNIPEFFKTLGDFPNLIDINSSFENLQYNGHELTFEDSFNQKTFVYYIKSELFIKKIINKKAYWGIFSSNVFAPQSLSLISECSAWISDEDPSVIHFLNRLTNQINYTYFVEKGLQSQIGLSKDLYIINTELFQNDYTLFQQFDSNFLVWKNKNHEVTLIEFPKYSLSFQVETNLLDGVKQFSCVQHPGFYLTKNSLIPILKNLKGYLTLKNDSGDIRVILQKIRLTHYSRNSRGIAEIMKPNSAKISDSISYFVYDWCEKKQWLSSSELCANLYLAYVFFAINKNEESLFLIQNITKKAANYNKNEFEIFSYFFQMERKTDLNSITLVLLLSAILLEKLKNYPEKNQIESTNFINRYMRDFLITSYEIYINSYSNITIQKLSKEQEILIINSLEYLKNKYLKRLHLLKKYSIEHSPVTNFFMLGEMNYHNPSDRIFPLQYFRLEHSHNSGRVFIPNRLLTKPLEKIIDPVPPERPSFFEIYETFKSIRDMRNYKNLITTTLLSTNFSDDERTLLTCAISRPEISPTIEQLKALDIKSKSMNFKDFNNLTEVKNFYELLKLTKNNFLTLHKTSIIHKEVCLPPTCLKIPSVTLDFSIPKCTDSVINEALLFGEKGLFIKQNPKILDRLQKQKNEKLNNLVKYLDKLESEQTELVFKYVIHSTKLEIHSLKISHSPEWILNLKHLKSIEIILKKTIVEQEVELKSLELEILNLANKLPLFPKDQILRKLSIFAKSYKPFNIKKLALLFMQQDLAEYQKVNSALTKIDVINIRKKLSTFFLLTGQQEQRKRAISCIDKIYTLMSTSSSIESSEKEEKIEKEFIEEGEYSELHALTQELYTELTTVSHVKAEYPEQLVFQYLTGMLLRKDQVETLGELINGKDADHLVLQRMMGSGKSKVLLPLLALRHADGINLAILVLPEELMEDTSNQMQLQSGELFHQSAVKLDWSDTSLQHLNTLYEALINIKTRKDFLLISNKEISLFSLRAKALRMNLEKPNDYSKLSLEAERKRLEIFRKILLLLKTSGFAVMDEIDVQLDCRHEVHISHGKPTSIDASRYDLAILIGEIMFLDDYFLSAFDFDCIKVKGKGSLFTEDVFNKEKPEFVHRVINKLIDLAKKSDKETSSIFSILGNNILYYPDITFRKWIEDYLSDDPSFSEKFSKGAIPNMLHDLNENQRNGWAFLREMIKTMSLTLSKNFNEHYGFFPGESNILAGPFAGAGKPKIGSEFGNFRELIMYTIQSYIHTGISEIALKKQINLFQDLALKDSSQIEETFLDICNGDRKYPLFSINDQQIQELCSQINGSHKRILNYVKKFILPTIMVPKTRITFLSQELVETFNKFQGFSGTPWNRTTYHSKLLTKIENGLDGLTWYAIGDNVVIVKSTEPKKLLKELDHMKLLHNSNAIIDAGALLKDLPEKIIADSLFELDGLKKRPRKISSIINYINNKQKIQSGKDACALPYYPQKSSPIDCFTIYDQKHCTGSDIPQAATASAILTVNKNGKIRDIQQSAWRMRRLGSGQSVTVCVPEKVADVIRKRISKGPTEPLTMTDVLLFSLLNQSSQVMDDNVIAIKQKLQNIITQTCEQILSEVPAEFLDIEFYHDLEQLNVTNLEDSPYKQYGAIDPYLDAPIVINKYLEQYMAKINVIIEKHEPNILREYKNVQHKIAQLQAETESESKEDASEKVDAVEINETMAPLAEIEKLSIRRIQLKKILGNITTILKPLTGKKSKLSVIVQEVFTSKTPLLPKYLQVKMDATVETTVEQEIEQEQEQEEEIDLDLCQSFFDNVGEHKQFEKLDNLPRIFSLDYFFSSPKALKDLRTKSSFVPVLDSKIICKRTQQILVDADLPYFSQLTGLFDENFYLSEAFLTASVNKLNPLGFFRKKMSTFLVIQRKDNNKLSIVMLSASEAGQLQIFLAKDKCTPFSCPRELRICLFHGNQIVQQGADRIDPDFLKESGDFQKLFVQAKFFDGEVFYSNTEKFILETWLSSQKDLNAVENLFSKELIKWQFQSRKHYRGSYLNTFFNKIDLKIDKKRKPTEEASKKEKESKEIREFDLGPGLKLGEGLGGLGLRLGEQFGSKLPDVVKKQKKTQL